MIVPDTSEETVLDIAEAYLQGSAKGAAKFLNLATEPLITWFLTTLSVPITAIQATTTPVVQIADLR